MVHLQQMKPLEFLQWARSVKSNFHGKLSNVPISLKVDGLGFRYGKDALGKPFVESSRSGPVSKLGSFTEYTKAKTDDAISLERSKHYDDILELFLKSNFIKALPNNTKVICEVLYNPMAELTDSGIKFVTINYDKSKLGKIMTVVVFGVVESSSGMPIDDVERILNSQLNCSNDHVKILRPNLGTLDLDISTSLSGLDLLDRNTEEILQSRKAIDKSLKAKVIAALDQMKEEIADYIINHRDLNWGILGGEMEGVVVTIADRQVKVTTDKFKEQKRAERK